MIDDVARTLVALLRTKLGTGIDEIQHAAPDQAGQGALLTLFPYAVVETPTLKNQPDEWVDHARSRKAPLTLDLYFLLSVHGARNANEATRYAYLALFARALRVVHDNGTLRGSALQGQLAAPERELHVTLNPISVEDLARLWAAFPQQPLRTSVSLLVTPVPVPTQEEYDVYRVRERQLRSAMLLAEQGAP